MSKPIYQIIQQLMDEQNLSIADTAKICDVPDSTVRGIISRKQCSIALDVAFRLSNGLGVSTAYLNGIEESETKKAPPSEDEDAINKNILEYVRAMEKLSETDRELVRGMIRSLSAKSERNQ